MARLVKRLIERLPTIQKFTSGSGIYITPAHVSHIRVRMAGGGAGTGGGAGGSYQGMSFNWTANAEL